MSKEISKKDKKKIILRWNKKFNSAKSTYQKLVYQWLDLGADLSDMKVKLGHGKWEKMFSNPELNSGFECSFGASQATRLMKISSEPELSLSIFNNDNAPTSIDGLCKRISNATDEEKAAAELIKQEAIDKKKQKAIDAAQAIEVEAKEPASVEVVDAGIIEGEFKEVDKEVKPEAESTPDIETESIVELSEMDELRNSLSELLSEVASLTKENDDLLKIFNDDDRLSAAMSEIDKQKKINEKLMLNTNQLRGKITAAQGQIKMWKSNAEEMAKLIERGQ